MSRSRRKTPIVGMCGGSEKEDKRIINRAQRRITRTLLTQLEAIEEGHIVFPLQDDVLNQYSMNKDGKIWIKNRYWSEKEIQKAMRK